MKNITKVVCLFVVSVLCMTNFAFAQSPTLQNEYRMQYEDQTQVLNVDSLNEISIPKDKKITPDEYLDLMSYTSFVIEENLTKDEVKYLNKLIKKGVKPKVVIDVTLFWKTTNEDISLIEKICDMRYDVWGNNWIENAFNIITNNKYGVIESIDELNSYLDKGLTIDDISAANILSRKGVLTLHQILEEKLSGKSWDEIIQFIDGDNITAEEVKSPVEKIKIKDLKKKGINVNSVSISNEEASIELEKLEKPKKEMYKEKAKQHLMDLEIICDENIIQDFYVKEYEFYKKLKNNRFRTYDMNSLKNKGFSYEEIDKIYNESEFKKEDLYITASKMKGGK